MCLRNRADDHLRDDLLESLSNYFSDSKTIMPFRSPQSKNTVGVEDREGGSRIQIDFLPRVMPSWCLDLHEATTETCGAIL
jgi:hypothetical protein